MFYTVPAEYLEAYYPLRIESYRANVDSGGAGRRRGGHGIRRAYTFEADGTITFQDDRRHTYPPGVEGGKPGEPSDKLLRRADGSEERLPSKVENLTVEAGDTLVFVTAGGGGLGSPLERDPELVATEVSRGLLTPECAEEEYGVVLDGGDVDEPATRRQREALAETDENADISRGDLPSERQLAERIAAARRRHYDSHGNTISDWEGKTYTDEQS
jgi:N-methylhydantoinase B